MKNILMLLLLVTIGARAQNNLPVVYLPQNTTIQFISPEPIQYVDISSKNVIGDLPLKNVLRIKTKDSVKTVIDAVITVTGEKFIAQYHVISGGEDVATEINIVPADMRPLDIAGIGFSQNQLKIMALNLVAQKPPAHLEQVKAFGIKARLNHIYAAGDYIFLDLGYENSTKLRYDIDDLRFKVDDKKVVKASNVQSVELKPVFQLFDLSVFRKYYRNIIVLKKLSFPGNKMLHVELSEKQLSGRVVPLNVSYQDILDADTLPLN